MEFFLYHKKKSDYFKALDEELSILIKLKLLIYLFKAIFTYKFSLLLNSKLHKTPLVSNGSFFFF